MYRFSGSAPSDKVPARLLGAGAILPEVIAAAAMLESDYGVAAEVFSVTSFSELSREAAAIERQNRFATSAEPAVSHLEALLPGDAPVIVASDYVRAVAQQIAPFVSAKMTILGTDGFGRSANRRALRSFFEIDRNHVVVATLDALVRLGKLDRAVLTGAIKKLGIATDAPAPWTV